MELYECKKCGCLLLNRIFAFKHWMTIHLKNESPEEYIEKSVEIRLEEFHLSVHYNKYRIKETLWLDEQL